jgi:hypothetical protein
MKKITFLVSALSLCGAAFAQTDMSWSMSSWSPHRQLEYRMCQTLNGSEQWEFQHSMDRLNGVEEDAYVRAINKASDANGAITSWNATTMTGTYGSVTTGSENQALAGTSMFAMSYQDRMGTWITDGQAYDLLLKSASSQERSIIEGTWDYLGETTQEAILHTIKRSSMIMAPTDAQRKWWK